MKWVNRSAILEYVRQTSPTARSEISRKLDLTMPTVVRIINELIEDGMVQTEEGFFEGPSVYR